MMLFQFCCEPQEEHKRSLDLLESVEPTTTTSRTVRISTTTTNTAEDTKEETNAGMETPESCATLLSESTAATERAMEEDMSTGALTPAMSNVTAGSSHLKPCITVSDATTVTTTNEEEEYHDGDDEESMEDSWEPIPPICEEQEEEEQPESSVPESNESTGVDYKERSLAVEASLVKKNHQQKTEHKIPSHLLVLVFLAALILAALAATGRLDSFLEEAVEARVRSKSSFVVTQVAQAPAVSPVPAPTLQEQPTTVTAIQKSTGTRTASPTQPTDAVKPVKKEYLNDSSNFVWLSLDDDVIAGTVFWENDTTLSKSNKKGEATAASSRNASKKEVSNNTVMDPLCLPTSINNLTSFFNQTKQPLVENTTITTITAQPLPITATSTPLSTAVTTIAQPTEKKRSMKKGPLHWIARHYQRLNVWVLGKSQLAQLKRKTNLQAMQWGPK